MFILSIKTAETLPFVACLSYDRSTSSNSQFQTRFQFYVLQMGYMLYDRVLRPAEVGVTVEKNAEESKEE